MLYPAQGIQSDGIIGRRGKFGHGPGFRKFGRVVAVALHHKIGQVIVGDHVARVSGQDFAVQFFRLVLFSVILALAQHLGQGQLQKRKLLQLAPQQLDSVSPAVFLHVKGDHPGDGHHGFRRQLHGLLQVAFRILGLVGQHGHTGGQFLGRRVLVAFLGARNGPIVSVLEFFLLQEGQHLAFGRLGRVGEVLARLFKILQGVAIPFFFEAQVAKAHQRGQGAALFFSGLVEVFFGLVRFIARGFNIAQEQINFRVIGSEFQSGRELLHRAVRLIGFRIISAEGHAAGHKVGELSDKSA